MFYLLDWNAVLIFVNNMLYYLLCVLYGWMLNILSELQSAKHDIRMIWFYDLHPIMEFPHIIFHDHCIIGQVHVDMQVIDKSLYSLKWKYVVLLPYLRSIPSSSMNNVEAHAGCFQARGLVKDLGRSPFSLIGCT